MASDVISPTNRARASTILLRAKWLIIIIIISYFLRFIEAPKPSKSKKADEININKSCGVRERERRMILLDRKDRSGIGQRWANAYRGRGRSTANDPRKSRERREDRRKMDNTTRCIARPPLPSRYVCVKKRRWEFKDVDPYR